MLPRSAPAITTPAVQHLCLCQPFAMQHKALVMQRKRTQCNGTQRNAMQYMQTPVKHFPCCKPSPSAPQLTHWFIFQRDFHIHIHRLKLMVDLAAVNPPDLSHLFISQISGVDVGQLGLKIVDDMGWGLVGLVGLVLEVPLVGHWVEVVRCRHHRQVHDVPLPHRLIFCRSGHNLYRHWNQNIRWIFFPRCTSGKLQLWANIATKLLHWWTCKSFSASGQLSEDLPSWE